MRDFIFRQVKSFIFFSFPRMEMGTGDALPTSGTASEAEHTALTTNYILAMSYVELRAIVVGAIVRNTNDKTKLTSLSVEIPVGLLKGGEPNSGNSIQIRSTSNLHKRNMKDKVAVGFHAHAAFLVRYTPPHLC
jgi:hypothetical protein